MGQCLQQEPCARPFRGNISPPGNVKFSMSLFIQGHRVHPNERVPSFGFPLRVLTGGTAANPADVSGTSQEGECSSADWLLYWHWLRFWRKYIITAIEVDEFTVQEFVDKVCGSTDDLKLKESQDMLSEGVNTHGNYLPGKLVSICSDELH